MSLHIKKDKIEMTEVNEDQIDEYIEAYLANTNRDGPGKKFIQKIKSCTGSMEHTTASAKKNRSRVLGMAAYFRLSSVMFTVSPDDRMNLRMRIYTRPGENINLPSLEDDVLLTDFVIECL